ncbi:MAG: nitroreductase family protein [Clostridiales bacterium]|nr:nitroreductase family protein [Clostridiales bacterium]
MDSTMGKWYEAAKKRVSVRKYSDGASRDEILELKDVANYLSTDEVRIVVGKKDGIFNALIGKTISGTDTFAAVISREGDNDYMVGSVGEAFVLECTAMGYGTCWLGLSYNKALANSFIRLDDDEKIRCLISVGHYVIEPAHKRTRKTIYNLTGLEDHAFRQLPDWQKCAIECGRLAPSARNAQPWEFDVLNDSLQVACVSKNFGYGGIDCGIAMLHLEIGAAHCGVYGDWQIEDRLPLFTVNYRSES